MLKWTMVSGNGQLLNINRLLELTELFLKIVPGSNPLAGTISV